MPLIYVIPHMKIYDQHNFKNHYARLLIYKNFSLFYLIRISPNSNCKMKLFIHAFYQLDAPNFNPPNIYYIKFHHKSSNYQSKVSVDA